MSQNLEFSATAGLTLTAIACPIGSYTGTAADSVTQQAGTDRYLAAFSSNLAAGAYRLDYALSGSPFGSEVYDVSGSGTFQPRAESGLNAAGVRAAIGMAAADLDTQLDAIATGFSVTVLPATGTETSRVSGTALTLFTSELIVVAVGVTDSDGVAVDLTGMTLELIFESGSTEVTIADADITKTTSSFSFTTTTALVSAEKLWKWALRKTTDGAVVVSGTMEVIYKPNN